MGASPMEKFKFIERYFHNLYLPTQGNLPGEAQLNFMNTVMGNLSLELPILYLALLVNHILPCAQLVEF